MFHQFLNIVQNGSVQNQFEIAEKMSISPLMVLQIARELTTRGYLQGSLDECDALELGCSGCPIGGSCKSQFNSWILTDKGKKAAVGS